MANARKNHMGPGTQGKGAGTGAMTDLREGLLGDNAVLSNRDKSRHGDGRGLDSGRIQTDQDRDHAASRRTPADVGSVDRNER